MTKSAPLLTIGETARRCGVATSTLRFYEDRGLINPSRTSGNQRLYHRSELRRISVIRVAQSLGLTLSEIKAALAELPEGRAPNKRDWALLSRTWRAQLDRRIHQLQRMRENLTECIGCGCLSLKSCALHNQGDRLASTGPGPRILLDPSAGEE
ncbi:MAG: redox-sensitive transcriptional activator SoxR [Kiloniellales bacterium]